MTTVIQHAEVDLSVRLDHLPEGAVFVLRNGVRLVRSKERETWEGDGLEGMWLVHESEPDDHPGFRFTFDGRNVYTGPSGKLIPVAPDGASVVKSVETLVKLDPVPAYDIEEGYGWS